MANPADSGDLKKAMAATTRAYLSSYEECTAQNDASLISRTRTPDCTHILRPESFFKSRGLDSVLSNAGYEAALAKDLEVEGMERVVISDVVVDVENRRSAATTVWDMVFKDGEVVVMEIAWFFEFNGEGDGIRRIIECVDPLVIIKTIEKFEKFGVA